MQKKAQLQTLPMLIIWCVLMAEDKIGRLAEDEELTASRL